MAPIFLLPSELVDAIFSLLDSRNARHLAGACRHLRQWSAHGWRSIELCDRPVSAVGPALACIADVLAEQPRLADSVEALVVRFPSRMDPVHRDASRADTGAHYAPLARVLARARDLATFVFSDVGEWRHAAGPDAVMAAVLRLRRLRTLSLGYVDVENLDPLPPPAFAALRHVVVYSCYGVNLTQLLGGQTGLHTVDVHISDDDVAAAPDFELACQWDEVRVLDAIPGDSDMLVDTLTLIKTALNAGSLRNLSTLSVRPESPEELSSILDAISTNDVPLTWFRLSVDEEFYKPDFGPSALSEIFHKIPKLERLCVDQDIAQTWPKTPQADDEVATFADRCGDGSRDGVGGQIYMKRIGYRSGGALANIGREV